MRLLGLAVLITGAASWGPAAGAALAETQLDDLVTASARARESIKTLNVEFETLPHRPGQKQGPPTDLGEAVQRVKWAQSGNTARWQFSSDFRSIKVEYLWKDDRLKVISSQGTGTDAISSGFLAPQPRLDAQSSSPWLHALFVSLENPHDP